MNQRSAPISGKSDRAVKLTVSHRSNYLFEPPTRGVVQSLRLSPSLFDGQKVLNWSVTVAEAEMAAAATVVVM